MAVLKKRGRSGRNKPDRRLSSQGPLTSFRSAIKRTTTRSRSQGDHSRERRRPEITILSAEPLATNAWFSGPCAGFPLPPPPNEHIWGGSIPATNQVQPPPSYDEVIREKTRELTPPPANTTRRITTSIATQTDFEPKGEAEASVPQCSIFAVEEKESGGGRPPKLPRPFFLLTPEVLESDTTNTSSAHLGESPAFLSEELTLTNVLTAEAINSLLDTSCGFQSSTVSSGSDLQAEPSEIISLDFPAALQPASPGASSALPSCSHPSTNSQPLEDVIRPTPRPRSRPAAKDVKIQTLVRLRDYGENIQENQCSGEVISGKYLQELIDIFGPGDQFLNYQSDLSSEIRQSERNDLADQSKENSMSTLRTKIQAFEKHSGVENANGEPIKRPEPRPRAQHCKPPPVAARPAIPTKPSFIPVPSDKAGIEKDFGQQQRPEANSCEESASAPTPAPRPQLPKKSLSETEGKEEPANLTRPPRPSVTGRPKNNVARIEDRAASPPNPPEQSKAVLDLLDLSGPPTVTVLPEMDPGCNNIETISNDVPTKLEQPLPDRPSVPQKPTMIRISSKPGKSSGDGSTDPVPPLPTQIPVGELAPQIALKSSQTLKSTPQSPAPVSTNRDKAGSALPLPPRATGGKMRPPRPPPAKMPPGRPPPPQTGGHKRSQSKGGSKKGPPLPPRPCPGHLLYNSCPKKNGNPMSPERTKSSNPDSFSTKMTTPLMDLSSSLEPQISAPKQAYRDKDRLQAQVLHDFTPEGPNELALRVGDMVSMVEKVDNEWYHGTCRGSSGIFPINHIKMLSNALNSRTKDEPVAAALSGPRCVARFSYDTEQGDELSFPRGAVIRLKEHVDQEWARGELSGHTGIFPLNFVEIVEDLPAFVPQSVEKTTEQSGLPASLHNKEPAKSCQGEPTEEEWALAMYDFAGQTDEDLSFKQGARIMITEHVDSEWCCGRLDGKEGLFPKAFVHINNSGGGRNNQPGING
ncbi:hypothetical protein GJAV_G00163000 [Gymnothorax javanicus]|nr:hypothetical protein GJAV_G00163000 [Gymnothorax javanicus]